MFIRVISLLGWLVGCSSHMPTRLAGSLAGQIRASTDDRLRRISSHVSRLVTARLLPAAQVRIGQPPDVEDGFLDAQ